MAIRFSPGCGCCEPTGCKLESIGFTPTTEQERENYPDWKPYTEYLAGDQFSFVSNEDSHRYLYRAYFTMYSGSGWTVFEESRYERLQRVDQKNEVDEWNLYGSGWDRLTDDQLHTFLVNRRLGDEMGLTSKSEVLPSSLEWTCNYNLNAAERPLPYPRARLSEQGHERAVEIYVDSTDEFAGIGTPFDAVIGGFLEQVTVTEVDHSAKKFTLEKPLTQTHQIGTTVELSDSSADKLNGTKIDFYQQISYDERGNIEKCFFTSHEYVSEQDDPVGTRYEPPLFPRNTLGLVEAIRSPVKTVSGKQTGLNETHKFDTRWLAESDNPRLFQRFCRGINPTTGSVAPKFLDPVTDLIQDLFALSPYPRLVNSGWIIARDGFLRFSAEFPDYGFTVKKGDFFRYVGGGEFGNEIAYLDNWEITPADELEVIDTYRGTVGTPDPGPMHGLRVGVYVEKLAPAAVVTFTGVDVSYARNWNPPSRINCLPCPPIGGVCKDITEKPLYVSVPDNGVALAAADGISNGILNSRWDGLGFQDGYGWSNRNPKEYDTFSLGTSVNRRAIDSYSFATISAKRLFWAFDSDAWEAAGGTAASDQPYLGKEVVAFTVQDTFFRAYPINGYQTVVEHESRVYCWKVVAARAFDGSWISQTKSEVPEGFTEFVGPHFIWMPHMYWGDRKVITGHAVNEPFVGALRMASAKLQTHVIDTTQFDCGNFTFAGTYDTDESFLNGAYNVWVESNNALGMGYTIQSIGQVP